ncbi:MAG: hypothetical protein ACM30G_07885 [Micromonosporaceae bacterium]
MMPDGYTDNPVEFDEETEDVEYLADEVDEMLDALIESDSDELSERTRRRPRPSRPGGSRPPMVRTATGTSAYRGPMAQGYVTQSQLREALARVGTDARRNAEGIKTVNAQLGRLTDQVRSVVTVNGLQNRRLSKLTKQMQLDAALDLAAAVTFDEGGGRVNLFQLLKGAVKSGALGEPKGALGNPLLIGGAGFLLNNPNIFKSITS